MAKGAYIGVDGKARKIKKGYIGVAMDIPIYAPAASLTQITGSNIAQYFTVTNDDNAFTASASDETSFASVQGSSLFTKTSTSTWEAKSQLTEISFDYVAGSKGTLTIEVAGTTVANATSGTTGSWTGSMSAGDKIVLNASEKNSSPCSTVSNIKIRPNVQSGVEIKSVARQIKKAYIGIGGVARPCWSGGELVYYGTTSSELNSATVAPAAATVGDYAVFIGGSNTSWSPVTQFKAYDSSLTARSPSTANNYRHSLAGASLGNKAIFAGGCTSSFYLSVVSTVNCYDASLSVTSPTYLSQSRDRLAAATIGDYVLFAGGRSASNGPCGTVDSYNTSGTHSTATALSLARQYLAATTIGNYALFGGGSGDGTSSAYSTVDAYDTSKTRTTPASLNATVYGAGATTVGNYALFVGGYNGSTCPDTATAYDSSLTRTSPTTLTEARYMLPATTIGDYAVFCKSRDKQYGRSNVDIYDSSLTKTILSSACGSQHDNGAATTVGNYAIFAGDSQGETKVDVYTIA